MRIAALALAALVGLFLAQDDGAEEGTTDILLAQAIVELKPGTPTSVTLPSDSAVFQGFIFDVPKDAKSAHLRVTDANADIDLVLLRERKADSFDDLIERSVGTSSSGRINEALDLDAASTPPLAPGKWWVYAGMQNSEPEGELQFSLTLAFDSPPSQAPETLPPFRELAGLSPLQRALDACVRLDTDFSSGSGTVIAPDGLILTCCHVLANDDGEPVSDGIYVSFNRDSRDCPVQTHLARMVEYDKALDLALVRVSADLDGKPAAGARFTWLPLAQAEPALDEDLRCVGYPAIGGSRSLCSISVTRGIVSGYVTAKGKLQWLKSDCLISSGNSGGTCVNSRWELQAVPTEAIHDGETMEGMAYLRPVSAMPPAWRELVAKSLKQPG